MSNTPFRRTLCMLPSTIFLGALTLCASAAGARPVPERPARTAESPAAGASPSTTRTSRSAPATVSFPDIPSERYSSHIALLAHDDLTGRGTGSDGIDLAAGYIAGQFAAAGLQPGGPNGTYFQEFSISRPGKILDDTALAIEGAPVEPELTDDYVPCGFSPRGGFAGEVVFVGYGITNSEKEYDDYAGTDVNGRVALMLRREPPDWNAPGGFTEHARFERKMNLAAKHGATAALIVNQAPVPAGVDELMRFRALGDPGEIPALHVKRAVADAMLAAAGLRSLESLQEQLDEAGTNASALLPGVSVSGNVSYEANEMTARNVIGLLPGTGARKDEYVVIGAHYDHLGQRRGRIYNGADDNASGTAGVIELAYALARQPRRELSALFMTFSGEEIGLLGSKHYVDDPTVPLRSIGAMLNMDMIGRRDDDSEYNKLAIQGLGTGDSFQEIIDRRSAEAGIPFVPDPSARGPSDHASFYEGGVPSLFFFTGVHEDYHQPGDDTEKINVRGAVEIVQLVYGIALDIINGDSAPVFARVDQPARIFRGAGPGSGVVMGIMPDMEDESDTPGWRIARVFPGGGAANAGMKEGDRIVRIDGRSILDFGDYRAVTADKKPGDTLNVTVLRGSAEQVLQVELSARPGMP